MARKKKPSKDVEAEVVETTVNETQEIITEDTGDSTVAEAEHTAEAMDAEEAVVEDTDSVDQPVEDDKVADVSEPEDVGDETIEETPAKDIEEVSETPELTTTTEAPSIPDSEPVVVRQGGFFPMVLGGILAAAIGFGLARYVLPEANEDVAAINDIQSKLDDQAGDVSALGAQIAELEAGNDLSAIVDAQSDNLAAISGLADRISDLETRLDNIESRPAGEGASGASLAAYEQKLNDLRSEVDAMTENAALLEENAQAAAQETLRRAALTRVQTALDAGLSFDSALADLEGLGVSIPDALRQTASVGVPSLTDLQESLPDAARSALSASRDASDGSGGGVTSFLRNQFGVRSLQPREGSDPDAVLSRIEAAAHDGRLTDALAEMEALPEEARAALSDWASLASRRLEAVAAAQELGESLN